MNSLTMETAKPFLAQNRLDRKKPNVKGEIKAAKFIKFTLIFAVTMSLVVLLIGLVFGQYLDNWPYLTQSPLGFSFKIGWLALGFSVVIYPFVHQIKKLSRAKTVSKRDTQKLSRGKVPEFGLYLGTATGILKNRNHGAAPLKNTKMVLNEEDSCKNILIEGGIGQGKTTLLMHSILLQLFDQNCGGLIFDIKANYKDAVIAAANVTKMPFKIIGPGHAQINLLEGLTPEAAAGFIKSVLLLIGKSNSDKIWLNTATDWCSAGLGMLSFIPKYYNLKCLYKYLFDDDYANNVEEEIKAIYDTLSKKDQRACDAYSDYLHTIFSGARDDFIKDVRSTVAQVIGPFTNPELEDAFCLQGNLKIDEVMDSVILVDLPLEKWGVGAKTAYTFLKLRFFALMNTRQTTVQPGDRPVFMMCDEYQEIVSANPDGLSDLSFWDKSRSAKCIGIISWHGVSSLYAAIGDERIANAIQQHFRQRMCLLTEDRFTVERINYMLGKVSVDKKSKTESKNVGEKQVSKTTSDSASESERSVVDAQLIRSLKRNQAVAMLIIDGYAQDDIIEFTPIYLEKKSA